MPAFQKFSTIYVSARNIYVSARNIYVSPRNIYSWDFWNAGIIGAFFIRKISPLYLKERNKKTGIGSSFGADNPPVSPEVNTPGDSIWYQTNRWWWNAKKCKK